MATASSPKYGREDWRRAASYLRFRFLERTETSTFTLLRFRADRPRLVASWQLERARIDSVDALVLLQQ